MPAYFARPAGNTEAPVIIVAMEIFGLHETSGCDAAPRQAWRIRVAPDYYFRRAST